MSIFRGYSLVLEHSNSNNMLFKCFGFFETPCSLGTKMYVTNVPCYLNDVIRKVYTVYWIMLNVYLDPFT